MNYTLNWFNGAFVGGGSNNDELERLSRAER
jgi:hypothetical protein